MLSVVDELCMPAYTNRVTSYHWILLIIRIDDGTVEVLDSLSKTLKITKACIRCSKGNFNH